jgi:hypothetical protein
MGSIIVWHPYREVSAMAENVGVEDFLSAYSPAVQELATTLRTLVREAAPEAQEKVYPGWKNIGYAGRALFCSISPYKDSVNLFFQQGASLEDPEGLLAGSGKDMRHVKVKKAQDIRPDYFKSLVKQAAAIDSK